MRLLLPLALLLATPAWAGPRRLALLVGSNDGGPRRALLRYAQIDAESIARVLGELGGVDPADLFLLRDPSAEALDQAWEQLDQRVRAAGPEGAEVLFYYSGHSDHQGLLLGGQTYAYDGLRATLQGLPARVRVGILDSCSSGAMVRGKGGHHGTALMGDLSTDVRGYALLTSASADEEAQESDVLGGSYFTAALVTGLRGAADHSGDGRVTLAEAYTFAYASTLADTERSRYGPQHAAYDMRLAGSGELVLTDVRGGGASLELPAGTAQQASVRDTAGHLVSELRPAEAQGLVVSLVPGTYVITLRREGGWAEVRVPLDEGEALRLDGEDLTWREGEPSVRRGPSRFLHWPVRVNTLATKSDPQVVDHVAINLLFGRCAHLYGVALGTGGTLVDRDAHGVLVAVGTNLVGDDASGLHIAGGLNLTGDNVRALQIAGGANVSGGYARGFLFSPGVNHVSGPAAGLLLAGGLNWVRDWSAGMQIASVNRAETLYGVQVGGVNLARRSYGLQLGLVNMGQQGSVAIGALNLFRQGRHHLALSSAVREPAALDLHLGTELLHNILGVGLRADGRVGGRWGLAGEIPLRARHRIEPGVVSSWAAEDLLLQGRVLWGMNPWGRVQLYLGPSWDLVVPYDGGGIEHGPGASVGVGVAF